MSNVTQSQITKANIDANRMSGTSDAISIFYVIIALCWIPALVVGPVDWVKMTWKIGAPMTGLALLSTAGAVSERKKLSEQIGQEKLQAQGKKAF